MDYGKRWKKISSYYHTSVYRKNIESATRIKLVFFMRCSYQSELLKIEWRNFEYGENASDMP